MPRSDCDADASAPTPVVAHHKTGWFTLNPTYLVAYKPVEASRLASRRIHARWSIEPHPGAIRIQWNPESCRATVSGLPASVTSSESAGKLAAQMLAAEASIIVHETLAKRELCHPVHYGLVPRKTAHVNRNQTMTVFGSRGEHYRTQADTIIPPPHEATEGIGWFAPTANPTEFGTLFVHATTESSFHDEGLSVRWNLCQTGIPRHTIAIAEWNDCEEIVRLHRSVAANDIEEHLAMVALTAPNLSLKRARDEHVLREQRHRNPGYRFRDPSY